MVCPSWGSLSRDLAVLAWLMDYRLACLDYLVDWLVAKKGLMVRADRRSRAAFFLHTPPMQLLAGRSKAFTMNFG